MHSVSGSVPPAQCQNLTARRIATADGHLDARCLPEQLTDRQLAEQLAEATNAAEVEQGLLRAINAAGIVNASVVVRAQAGHYSAWIIADAIRRLDGAEPLHHYFARFDSDEPIARSDFEIASRYAETHARRAGFEPYALYESSPGGNAGTTMKLRVEDQRKSPWDYNYALNNTGERYLGRWFTSIGAAYTQLDSTRLGAQLSSSLPALGEDPSDGHYLGIGLFEDHVQNWGLTRFDLRYADFDYLDFGSGRRLSSSVVSQPPPRVEASIASFSFGAEQLLHAGPLWSWSLDGQIGGKHYRRRVAEQPESNSTESYSHATAGLRTRWHAPEAWGRPVWFARLALRTGLGLGKLEADAQEHFIAPSLETGAAINIGPAGRISAELAAQHSADPLPEAEEWLLGGSQRLRAWLPGVIVGDRGHYQALRYQPPTLTLGKVGLVLELAYERGVASFVRQDAAGERPRQMLSDMFANLRLETSSPWSVEISAAKPDRSSGLNQQYLDAQRVDYFLSLSRGWSAN